MEVTRQTFESALPAILDAIYSADFVAIDGEYTGIETASARRSYFDSPSQRYAKCRSALRQSAVLEFGLATFRRLSVGNSFDNRWEARVFNFPVCPAAFEPLGREFACTSASLEFLRRHGLDLNRVVDQGVYYLNEAQEAQLRRLLKKTGFEPPGAADEEALAAEAARISALLSAAAPDAEFRVAVRRIGCLSSFGLRAALSVRLPQPADSQGRLVLRCEPALPSNVHNGSADCPNDALSEQNVENDPETVQSDGCVLWIIRQLCQNSADAASATPIDKVDIEETEKFVQRCVGFSRVFRALVNLRKPLVGHNCFVDLLAMYEYFYRPLPIEYEAWKVESFRRLTPLVWDTKHLLYQLRSASGGSFSSSSIPVGSLEASHAALSASDGAGGVASAPTVTRVPAGDLTGWAAHRAGWDAFMAGELFLRVSHRMLLLSLRPGLSATAPVSQDIVRRPSFAAYRRVLESEANCVNLIKARQHCVRLDAPDPESRRPPVLVLTRRDRGQVDLLWVRDLVARFGLADLRSLHSGQHIVIAMSTFPGARDVARELAGSAEFCLEPLSRLRHSRSLRLAIWAGTAAFTALAVRSLAKMGKSLLASGA